MLYWLENDTKRIFKYAYKDLSLTGYTRDFCTKCGRSIVSPQYIETPPHLILEGGRQFPDFLQFCGAGNRLFVVSEKALSLFEKSKVTGFSSSERCLIECISTNRVFHAVPVYYSLEINGRVDLDLIAMHLKKKNKCDACSQFTWSRTRIDPLIIDLNTWDGSDICLLDSIPGLKLCSEKVVDIVKTNRLTGFSLSKA